MIPQLTAQPASAAAVARHYGSLLRPWWLSAGTRIDGVRCLGTAAGMTSREDRLRLAREVLAFASQL